MDKLADLWAQLVKEGMEEKKFFKMFEPQAPKKYSMFKNGAPGLQREAVVLLASAPSVSAACGKKCVETLGGWHRRRLLTKLLLPTGSLLITDRRMILLSVCAAPIHPFRRH